MLTTSPIPGFDPSAPMHFHTSNFGPVLTVVIIVGLLAIAATAFLFGDRGGYLPSFLGRLLSLPTAAAVMVTLIVVAAVTIPVSPVAPARFDACTEAAGWAKGRYDVELSEVNCEELFKARQWITIGPETHQTLLADGDVLRSKKIGDQVILVDELGQELPKRIG